MNEAQLQRFHDRFRDLPRQQQRWLRDVAAMTLNDKVTPELLQLMLRLYDNDIRQNYPDVLKRYGWVLERMNTEANCEWVLQQEVS